MALRDITDDFGTGQKLRTVDSLRSYTDDLAFMLASNQRQSFSASDISTVTQAANNQGLPGSQVFPTASSQVPERFMAGAGISIKPGVNPVVSPQLLSDLRQAIKDLGISVLITDALRPEHAGYGAKNSRHHAGKALDIGQVNGRTATLGNPDAVRFVQYMIAHGYQPGVEFGSSKSLLFGPGTKETVGGSQWNHTPFSHATHIHIGIR